MDGAYLPQHVRRARARRPPARPGARPPGDAQAIPIQDDGRGRCGTCAGRTPFDLADREKRVSKMFTMAAILATAILAYTLMDVGQAFQPDSPVGSGFPADRSSPIPASCVRVAHAAGGTEVAPHPPFGHLHPARRGAGGRSLRSKGKAWRSVRRSPSPRKGRIARTRRRSTTLGSLTYVNSRVADLIERRSAGQLVDLAAHEGIGEGGVAADERLGEQVDGLPDEAVELLGAELLDHVGDGGLLGGLLVDLAGLLLAGRDLAELGFQLAAAGSRAGWPPGATGRSRPRSRRGYIRGRSGACPGSGGRRR